MVNEVTTKAADLILPKMNVYLFIYFLVENKIKQPNKKSNTGWHVDTHELEFSVFIKLMLI